MISKSTLTRLFAACMAPFTMAYAQPAITANGIANAASYASGAVAPGELVTIFGSGLGPTAAASAELDERGYLSTAVAGTRVLFDGVPAPLVNVHASRVSAFVPYAVAGRSSTSIQVVVEGQPSNAVSVAVQRAVPGIFTADSSGRGQALVINQDGSLNSASRPAATGSIVLFYVTGEGQTDPPGVDGKPADVPAPRPVEPVTVTIGDREAEVLYAGGSPGLPAGLMQLNVRVPGNVPTGASVSLAVNVGRVVSNRVTLAVQGAVLPGGPLGADARRIWVVPGSPGTIFVATRGAGIFKSTNTGSTWQSASAGIPAQGDQKILCVAAESRNPSIAYATTEGHGVYKTVDGGATWAAVNRGMTDRGSFAILTDPATPGTVYVGGGSGKVFRTTDGGANWTNVNANIPEGAYITSMRFDPSNPRTMYLASPPSGIHRSADGGLTWTRIGEQVAGNSIQDILVDPNRPNVLFAGAFGSGIWRSIDSGATWSNVLGNSLIVLSLEADRTRPGTIYAGTLTGAYKTTDVGATWTPVNVGLANPVVQYLAIDPGNPDVLYAATRGGIFRTGNGGLNWSAANNGISGWTVRGLQIDRNNPSVIYAGTSAGGVFRSTDAGATWAQFAVGNNSVQSLVVDPLTPNTLFAGIFGGDGVLRSNDSGQRWTGAGSGIVNTVILALAAHPTAQGTIYAASYGDGVYKTVNAGTSWTAVNAGSAVTRMTALAIDSRSPETVYAAGEEGLARTTDGGRTWTFMTRTIVFALSVDPSNSSTLYAASFSGVLRSTNGGADWVEYGGAQFSGVRSLIFEPGNPSVIYAAAANGVFKSTNRGETWAGVNLGLPAGVSITALAVHPSAPQVIYAGTEFWGVYKSTNGGQSWTPTGTAIASFSPI